MNMKAPVIFLMCLFLANGCETTRSISHYQYGYNPSYRGELSEVEFIKDISSGAPAGAAGVAAPIRIGAGERVIVLQSGQIRPDETLLAALTGKCAVIPMSGVPSEHSVGGPSLREAARAGGVSKIIAYWGSIETSIQPRGTKAISWVPIAGWYIPDESQRMRVSVSAIVSDVATGRWSDITAVSGETEISHSSMNSQSRDSRQVEQLKAEAYLGLAGQLTR